MKLYKNAEPVRHDIIQPRWHDRSVLVHNYKLGLHNIITFRAAPSLAGEWYVSGSDAAKCATQQVKSRTGYPVTNRIIPIDKLQPFEGFDEE